MSDWITDAVRNGGWTLREDGLYHNPDDEEIRICISEEDTAALEQIRDYWQDRTIGATAEAWKPDGFVRSLSASASANTVSAAACPSSACPPAI
jgi:formate C-acetyltransferase